MMFVFYPFWSLTRKVVLSAGPCKPRLDSIGPLRLRVMWPRNTPPKIRFTRDGKSWKNKEWVRNFFDFKLWTVWFYGGLNNGENTITINGKSHILPYTLLGQVRNYFSCTYANPHNFADIPTMMKSSLLLRVTSKLAFWLIFCSLSIYIDLVFSTLYPIIFAQGGVTWLRAATAMFMPAHFSNPCH